MNIWSLMLRLCGWDVRMRAPRRAKCVICVAPHTSNWDFIIGLAAYRSLGRTANFLMKESWFFWPLKYLLHHYGGIPVRSKRKSGVPLTQQIVADFNRLDYMNLAITPEGTRSAQPEWHTGIVRIAYEAKVPIQIGLIDFRLKEVTIDGEFNPTGDFEKDIQMLKAYYYGYDDAARYPDKFAL
ncbi:MAG: 1-acyl-sn-glycerol-3-phosphate acyltransferase [Muribaculaceae bacterium]|nr:1-acyl-sn-glycerol-3-phosphate acyltransferase [Muribaculaceae bacterium]